MLFPKNYNFGKLFQDMSGGIIEIFDTFDNLSKNYKDLDWYAKKSEIIETQVDHMVHDVINQLNISFITPFDREDLHLLVVELDNIVDYIDEAIHMIKLYELKNKPEFLNEFSIIYLELAKNLQSLITETFKSKKDMSLVSKLVISIKVWENQADKIYLAALHKLFNEEKDPIEVIKIKDILEKLETVADNYKYVWHTIENMLIKMG